MQQTPSDPNATSSSTESVSRPEPGLARGKWEAPAWVFWVMLAVVLLGAGAYLLRRLGLLRLPTKNETPPPSSKTQHP